MRTKVINFFGGPDSGKSATAALLYGALVARGFSADLIHTSNAYKDCLLPSSYWHVAEQRHLLEGVARHADIVVCDAPMLQSLAYYDTPGEDARLLATEGYAQFDCTNILVRSYSPVAQHSDFDYWVDSLVARIKQLIAEELENSYLEVLTNPDISITMETILRYLSGRGVIL